MSTSDLRADPRALIAAETAALVAERGLEAATLRRVAQRLDCTTGFISHYYASKEELLEAALESAVRALIRAASTAPAPRNLEEWVDRVVTSLPEDEHSRRFWRVLVAFQAASLASDRLADVLRTYAADGKDLLFALLRAAAPDRTPDADVQELTDALWVLVDGFGTTAALNPQAFQPSFVRTALLGAVHALLADLQERNR